MAKTKNSSGKAKFARELNKNETALLDQLQSAEAALVLRRWLADHPELLSEAEEISRSTLGDVSLESIASEVEVSIRQLNLDGLNGRVGRHNEATANALECWLSGCGREASAQSVATKRCVFPQDFINAPVPEWREMLEGVLCKEIP